MFKIPIRLKSRLFIISLFCLCCFTINLTDRPLRYKIKA